MGSRRGDARRAVRISVVALCVLALGGCAPEGPLELKLAHAAPPEALIAIASDEFARRANERLGERAQVVVYGGAQLGDDRTVLQKLRLGTIDFSVPATVLSSESDALGFFEMPYLIKDREHLRRIEESIFWSDIAPLVEEDGYRVVALWENGFRHVTNNVRPIRTPDDLRGIKIRTPNSPWRVRLFRALGANPSPMPFSEVFVALQTGVMDGQENPLTNILTASFDQTQEYLSLTRHVYSPAYLTVDIDRWNRLPDDVRTILEETARETQAFILQAAADIDERTLETLRSRGIAVNEVDREAFVGASAAVYAEFGELLPGGDTLIARALELAND